MGEEGVITDEYHKVVPEEELTKRAYEYVLSCLRDRRILLGVTRGEEKGGD